MHTHTHQCVHRQTCAYTNTQILKQELKLHQTCRPKIQSKSQSKSKSHSKSKSKSKSPSTRPQRPRPPATVDPSVRLTWVWRAGGGFDVCMGMYAVDVYVQFGHTQTLIRTNLETPRHKYRNKKLSPDRCNRSTFPERWTKPWTASLISLHP